MSWIHSSSKLVRVSDNEEINLRVGLELENWFDSQSLIIQTKNSLFPVDCVIVNPTVVKF